MNDNTSFDTSPTPALVEQVLAEQRRCWQRGERLPVEVFLARSPTLGSDKEGVLHLIFNEVVLREQAGEIPTLEELQGRFPDLAAELEVQFALDQALRGGASQSSTVDPAAATSRVAPASRQQAPPAPPGYEILGELGRGGMGVVYKARHLALKRVVALKVIRDAEVAGAGEISRFRREAEAVARLQHPNIAQIFEVGEFAGRPFFALEYVAGGTLSQKIAGTPLVPAEAARLAEVLARAVEFAHEQGLVHRDLKPANILMQVVDRRLQTEPLAPPQQSAISHLLSAIPKIADFGLAKRLDADPNRHSLSGCIVGTPSYMAPEQAAGKTRETGRAADVYALGAILYEMLTGRPPFKGHSQLDTLRQVLHDDPVPPVLLQPRVPRDLETVCLKCLRKAPHERYASAELLAEDLRRFGAGEPILARPAGRAERLLKWARRRPAQAALAVAVAAVFLSLIVLALVGEQSARHYAQVVSAELREEQRVNGQRSQAQKEMAGAEMAWAQHDLVAAQLGIKKALALLAPEPALAHELAQAQQLDGKIQAALTGQKTREEQRAKLVPFAALRDEAQFHYSHVTGLNRAANLSAVRRLAGAALAVWGLTAEPDGGPAFDSAHFSADERALLAEQCYVLLLLLADATCEPLADEQSEAQADQALRLLDQAALCRAPTVAYHHFRARCLAQLGKAIQAATERQLAGRPATALDYFVLAADQCHHRQYRLALDHLDQAQQLQPDHFWVRFLTAVCYLRSQRPAEAKAHLDGCISARPDFVWSYLVQGFARSDLAVLALAGGSRYSEAGSHFRAAEALFQRAEESALSNEARYTLLLNRGILRLRQAEAAAELSLLARRGVLSGDCGMLLLLAGAAQSWAGQRLEAAAADFQAAIDLRPQQYQAFLNLARVRELQGRPQDALAALMAAVAKESGAASVYRSRARWHRQAEQLDAALEDLDRAIARAAGDGSETSLVAEDHKERGVLLLRATRHAEALAAFDAALRMRPDFAVAWRLQAETLLFLDRLEAAVSSFDVYLDKAAQALPRFQALGEPVAAAYKQRGLARAKLGRVAEALEDYSAALKTARDADTLALRGWLYLTNKAPQLALSDFQDALRLDPHQASALAGRGNARVLLNKVEEAMADAQEAARLGAKDHRTLYNAARVLSQASTLLRQGTRPDPQRLELHRQACCQRALQLLEQALEVCPAPQRGAFWNKVIACDPALAAVQRTTGYAVLAAQFGRAGG
jgi:tetratricopeptide (TPR) repeat protein